MDFYFIIFKLIDFIAERRKVFNLIEYNGKGHKNDKVYCLRKVEYFSNKH